MKVRSSHSPLVSVQRFLMSTVVAMSTLMPAASVEAAPMPATSSSKLVAPQLGLYRSPSGFEIHAGGSGWMQAEAPKDSKFIQTVYRAHAANADAGPDAARASLTVRVDNLDKPMALPKYIQRWRKEYPKYGFDILGSKSFNQNNAKGFVLDLLNRDTQKQIRQVVFMKDTTAIILTCRDDSKSFNASLKSCNQIIRTFNWVQ
jgi:hypothetical protein